MSKAKTVWVAADYHFPSTYSCRVPLSSAYCALALPAPGPATIRFALIRTCIEVFGVDYTLHTIFPTIRAMSLFIRPPEKVAISTQLQRAYKVNSGGGARVNWIEESPMYREVAQTTGYMTLYLTIPHQQENVFRQLLTAIGYWGQASSFTCCIGVHNTTPVPEECLTPLTKFIHGHITQKYFCSLVSEFSTPDVSWEAILPLLRPGKQKVVHINIFVWPMVILSQQQNSKLLLRKSLMSNM